MMVNKAILHKQECSKSATKGTEVHLYYWKNWVLNPTSKLHDYGKPGLSYQREKLLLISTKQFELGRRASGFKNCATTLREVIADYIQ